MTERERKIGRMQSHFGVCEGKKCKECCNFSRYMAHDRVVFKCEVYGVTSSEATDWRASYPACGWFNKYWVGGSLMKYFNSKKEQMETSFEGQMTLFEKEGD